MAAAKKPAFEGKLIYKGAGAGLWYAGVPKRDITSEEWEANDYSQTSGVSLDQLIDSGVYDLRAPRGSASANANANANTGEAPAPAPAPVDGGDKPKDKSLDK